MPIFASAQSLSKVEADSKQIALYGNRCLCTYKSLSLCNDLEGRKNSLEMARLLFFVFAAIFGFRAAEGKWKDRKIKSIPFD
jgi:hypothetical protein